MASVDDEIKFSSCRVQAHFYGGKLATEDWGGGGEALSLTTRNGDLHNP